MTNESGKRPAPPSRLALHVVLTLGGALAMALGELVGNLTFHEGVIDGGAVANGAVVGAIIGNVVAWWVWGSRKKM